LDNTLQSILIQQCYILRLSLHFLAWSQKRSKKDQDKTKLPPTYS